LEFNVQKSQARNLKRIVLVYALFGPIIILFSIPAQQREGEGLRGYENTIKLATQNYLCTSWEKIASVNMLQKMLCLDSECEPEGI